LEANRRSRVCSPFGIKTTQSFSSIVVLDKSFLDTVSLAQFQLYAQQGWIFAITEVLMHEQLRKTDEGWRKTNFFKLHKIQKSLRLLPGIGEMFRAETKWRKPASHILSSKYIDFTPVQGPSGEYFELDEKSARSLKEKEVEYRKRCDDMIEVWRDFDKIPELHSAVGRKEMPAVVKSFEEKIRDDREDMRGFYGRHRHRTFPELEQLDEKWAFFRWTQVQLLGGLTYYASYGVDKEPQMEKLLHELFDLSYVIYAALLGGFACIDKRPLRRFKLLRPDGIVLSRGS
jgi:hypothetical protein